MKRTKSRHGFTLIEVLVASLLLGMLVTILTMVFNQTAIAWRTGKAGVARLSTVRRGISLAQGRADNLLPRIDSSSKNQIGTVLSAWDEDGRIRKRAVGTFKNTTWLSLPSFSAYKSSGIGSGTVDPWLEINDLGALRSGKSKSYIVGVLSYGPDRKRGTDDDITSWPGDVQ